MPRYLIKNVEKMQISETDQVLRFFNNSLKLKKKNNIENSIRRSMESIEGSSFSQRFVLFFLWTSFSQSLSHNVLFFLTTSISQRLSYNVFLTTYSSQRLSHSVWFMSFSQRFPYILVLTKYSSQHHDRRVISLYVLKS